MANKVTPKISKPGSDKFPTKGPHNPNVGTRGSGMAPKPKGGAPIPGNDRPSMPAQGGVARVSGASSSPSGYRPTAGSFMPVQNNAMANLKGQATGQNDVAPRGNSASVAPQTSTPVTRNDLATKKPRRRGIGAAFYGEY